MIINQQHNVKEKCFLGIYFLSETLGCKGLLGLSQEPTDLIRDGW